MVHFKIKVEVVVCWKNNQSQLNCNDLDTIIIVYLFFICNVTYLKTSSKVVSSKYGSTINSCFIKYQSFRNVKILLFGNVEL